MKFLKCIISRINLCSPSIPNGLKASALNLLKNTCEILLDSLQNCTKFNEEMTNLIDCYYACGLLCVLLNRFSLEAVGQKSQLTSEVSILELNDTFFTNLNKKFYLIKKIKDEVENIGTEKENLRKLFLLVNLNLKF